VTVVQRKMRLRGEEKGMKPNLLVSGLEEKALRASGRKHEDFAAGLDQKKGKKCQVKEKVRWEKDPVTN